MFSITKWIRKTRTDAALCREINAETNRLLLEFVDNELEIFEVDLSPIQATLTTKTFGGKSFGGKTPAEKLSDRFKIKDRKIFRTRPFVLYFSIAVLTRTAGFLKNRKKAKQVYEFRAPCVKFNLDSIGVIDFC